MIDYDRFIKDLGKCYHLQIRTACWSPEHTHRIYVNKFVKAMRLRCLRRFRPTYLRMVNILRNNTEINMYHYISDIVSPSLLLIAEMCPPRPIDVEATKLTERQVIRCFDFPIKTQTMGPGCIRIITILHPHVVMTKLLEAYPKSIRCFYFGVSHVVYTTPSIDYDDYFRRDKIDFSYKSITKYQPIHYDYETCK